MTFKSGLEEQHNKELKKARRKHRFKYGYETQKLPYVVNHSYIPDWKVVLADGRTFYIESKGYLRPSDRAKLVAVRRCNEGLDLRIVFQQDNYIRKGSKTRYSDWAKRHGLQFSVGNIPEEWFK